MHRLLRRSGCRHASALSYDLTALTQGRLRGIATSTGENSGAGSSSPPNATVTTAKPPRLPGGPTTPPPHPMERLSYVFQHHPSALRLHRELTLALANGDAARAADLAGVLATTVQSVITRQKNVDDERSTAATGARGSTSTNEAIKVGSSSDLPTPSLDDVDEVVEKTREAVLLQRATFSSSAAASHQEGSAEASTSVEEPSRGLPFWRDPQHLCVTVLESAFETEVPDGEAQNVLSAAGNRAAEHEAQLARVLETYLEKDGARWKTQKAAIAKIVLEVARALKVTPEDLQSAEGVTPLQNENGVRLNVLRHTNLVVRGEVPSTTATHSSAGTMENFQHNAIDAQLAALTERMQALGTPLTLEETQMARYELQMSQSKMRYVVGVHRELQLALDNSESLKHTLQQRRAAAMETTADAAASPPMTGTQLFMDEVIRALNEGAEAFSVSTTAQGKSLSVEDLNAREAAENPVLPFTFMLKCCLWFDAALPS